MNYYYDLPQDIIEKIENINKEEELIEEGKKTHFKQLLSINTMLSWIWDVDYYREGIEDGDTISEIVGEVGEGGIKEWIKGMEKYYLCKEFIIEFPTD